ncbi:MAG TPA: L,D-transpeptidase family protein, partial [Thermoanaerobaculia bacterium]|nr:L,D-transpeptidase family protein [Thermoanaerobaculia bacterium]
RGWRARRRARAEAAEREAAAAEPPPPAVYDAAVEQAVRRFQARHGLEATGTVGKDTLAALNVPAAARARQLEVNMERWRWMPASLGERHIFVNVPAYALRLVEGDRTVLAMKVIVGKDQSRTPAFSDQMTYLELNPYWNVPPSIYNEEIAPKVAADSSYLARNDMEYVEDGGSVRVRQRPGPANPLGQIKFMFPNQFNIYLHDTPADHLFDVAERGFSHGCIRIEKPMELAEYLLRDDPKWSRAALQEAIDSGESRSLKLPRPIAVHILYWTAWVEPDGTVQFRDDLYGHDATLDRALAEEPPVDLDLRGLQGSMRAAR